MTHTTIRELMNAQAEQKQHRNARIFGGFQRDVAADGMLAALKADPSFRSRLSPSEIASLESYEKARTAHEGGQQR